MGSVIAMKHLLVAICRPQRASYILLVEPSVLPQWLAAFTLSVGKRKEIKCMSTTEGGQGPSLCREHSIYLFEL